MEYSTALAVQPSIWYGTTKRAIDILLALIGLTMAAPILAGAALAIMCATGGGAFYRQARCGKNGRMFNCWKLRTMVTDAEAILFGDSELAARFKQHYKLHDDPRVTPMGRILRRTSIDELPQLWNILLGNMSIVGPRPVTEAELRQKYGVSAPLVLTVKPGLTGLWQVSGRSQLTYQERVRLDLDYIARRSLALDLAILARTPKVILTGRGAT